MRVLAAVSLAALSACGTEPIQQDQPIVLAAGQGLAAVVFDTKDPLTDVVIESSDTKLGITNVPVGTNLYMFQVPAGSYCFTKFYVSSWIFHARDKQGQCFEVKAGELGYGGVLAPRAENGEVMTHRDMDLDVLREQMRAHYPIVAKQFLPSEVKDYTAADLKAPAAATAAAPIGDTAVVPANLTPHDPPAAGKDQISSWMEEVPGTLAQVIFIRNNTGWPMQVKRFELYDCVAVKQKCGVQNFTLTLAAHATKQVMVVEPDDPHDAYTFRDRYIYGFVQNSKP
ncbi:MAG TPA: hypothetical protein VH327_04315 [Gammaproteobacteria bacterium]|nr:hypothetical protein [Gammaproteobacteria bacterium]